MRLIIAEDAALLREGLNGLLERQYHQILDQVATADELETTVHQRVLDGDPPDVIITDIRMPPTMTHDGLAAATRIRSAHPQIGIMVLSQYVAPAYAADLFSTNTVPNTVPDPADHAGGLGYLLKERIARVSDFMNSLEIVAAGGTVVDPDVTTQLIANQRDALSALTSREHDVLDLMARGLSNTQIGQTLTLSSGAVAKHVANIFTKLDLAPDEDNRRVRAVLAYLSAGQ